MFLDRTGSDFFTPVRELLQTWLDRVPVAHQADIVGELTSREDDKFESAFWELYLHQVLTGSGIEVTIHPSLPGSSNRPDFLAHADEPFYLEAVRVGTVPAERKKQSRLSEVEAALEAARVDGWTLSFKWHEIGPSPLASARVRGLLRGWLRGLDRDEVIAALRGEPRGEARGSRGTDDGSPMTYEGAYTCRYAEDGWDLEFDALPVLAGAEPRLVTIRGTGRASGANNEIGLRRVLEPKSKRYGTDLAHPLVLAVLSNTDPPTRAHDLSTVLYGSHELGLAQVSDPGELADVGHWRTRQGWRRSHNPYVVLASGLGLYNVHVSVPWVCRTLDPSVEVHLDLPWAAPVDLTTAWTVAPVVRPELGVLGVGEDWCSGFPEYEATSNA